MARERVGAAGEASVPNLTDVETVTVQRKRWLGGTMTARPRPTRHRLCGSWRSSVAGNSLSTARNVP